MLHARLAGGPLGSFEPGWVATTRQPEMPAPARMSYAERFDSTPGWWATAAERPRDAGRPGGGSGKPQRTPKRDLAQALAGGHRRRAETRRSALARAEALALAGDPQSSAAATLRRSAASEPVGPPRPGRGRSCPRVARVQASRRRTREGDLAETGQPPPRRGGRGLVAGSCRRWPTPAAGDGYLAPASSTSVRPARRRPRRTRSASSARWRGVRSRLLEPDPVHDRWCLMPHVRPDHASPTAPVEEVWKLLHDPAPLPASGGPASRPSDVDPTPGRRVHDLGRTATPTSRWPNSCTPSTSTAGRRSRRVSDLEYRWQLHGRRHRPSSR